MNAFISGEASDALNEGLYEALHTASLARRLGHLPEYEAHFEKIGEDDVADILSRHIAEAARAVLAAAKSEDRLALANKLLEGIQAEDSIMDGPRQLLSLHAPDNLRHRHLRRPLTPLSDSALLTNGKGDPNLAGELRAEMASADSVDLLSAFIKWSGLRLLEPALDELVERGVRIRVITTTYMGATERRAVDELVRRYGADVRISYETQSTRLHAKAWLFRRNTGFDTAYVGSSNLSRPALLDGLEWNVRLSSVTTPALLNKFEVTFDSYWEQRAFVSYDPEKDAERLDAALLRNGGTAALQPMGATGLEVQPHLHQVEMLEELEASRGILGHHRNLIVAATGTGKTVVAALDYKRLCDEAGRPLTLLFVAHRKEILEQSLRTYRTVMESGSFGELYVDEQKPTRWKHVFASVQSAKGMKQFEADYFDVVVIDEFHHAEAPTYRKIIDHLRPLELLGLTATPERGDGINVADEFFGGRITSELRLWDALDADLLVPFHYFGLADDVDLSQVEWRKSGNYDVEALSVLYTGNDARAAKVIKELRDKVLSTREMRAIGFCVSVQHAHYMARVFNQAGITSVAVSGATDSAERATALAKLRSKEINCVFAVDLFNEGLDVPEIDTILLLRPTQSSTIFLQQLGRGLRRAEDKAVLSVLDFIGQQRREFRFDPKFRALTGTSRMGLVKQIEDEFPLLPSGCQIILDRVAQQTVLQSIKSQLRFNRKQLIADVRSYGEVLLEDYLRESGRDLREVYRNTGDSWTSLIREARLINGGIPPVLHREGGSVFEERLVLKKMTSLLHVDDPERAETYMSLVAADALPYEDLGEREKVLARMMFFALWPDGGGFEKYDDGFDQLRAYPYACSEIRQMMKLGPKSARHMSRGLGMGLQHIPMYSHATYSRYEVLAALGLKSLETDDQRKLISTNGVAWCPATQTDALLVTLNKDEKKHSANTMYRDYALSQDRFHWESQHTTSTMTPAGRRYLDRISHGSHIVLFTREREKDDFGMTMPYTCLGQVDYVSHSGEKPIGITWELQRAMPADVYAVASAVAR